MLYPAINSKNFEKSPNFDKLTLKGLLQRQPKKHLLVSLNRYERKKDIGLAIRAYAKFYKATKRGDCMLVVAGGYDKRLSENVEYHKELVALGE